MLFYFSVNAYLFTFGAKQLLLCDYSKISNAPISLLSKEIFIFPTQWCQGGWLKMNVGDIEQHFFSE